MAQKIFDSKFIKHLTVRLFQLPSAVQEQAPYPDEEWGYAVDGLFPFSKEEIAEAIDASIETFERELMEI